MAIKVKSSLQTPIGLSFQNLILSICGVYQVQKTLVTANLSYYVNRQAQPLKTETVMCTFGVGEHPAQALYNSLKARLIEEGVVRVNDIEDC